MPRELGAEECCEPGPLASEWQGKCSLEDMEPGASLFLAITLLPSCWRTDSKV
jgi:hypothetical protein